MYKLSYNHKEIESVNKSLTKKTSDPDGFSKELDQSFRKWLYSANSSR